MVYVDKAGIDDILAFVEKTLNEPNLICPENNRVCTHDCAKWIVRKLRLIQHQMEVLRSITLNGITYPLSDGVLENLSRIKDIQNGDANE